MPKVTEEYIVNKKKRITDAAYELCLEKTVSTVTMQDIIDRTGLSQGGIYRFYKDIDGILSDMIRQMRERESIKEQIDEILGQKDVLPSQEITDRLFAMLADFMERELMGIEKIDFELSVLAMNRPDRIEKIMGGIPEVGNMEYLTMRTMEYFKEQAALGRIHANMSAEELLAFISSAYGGIQMTCIVNNCYRHERNPLAELYQPRVLLKMLAQTVNDLIGAKEDCCADAGKEKENSGTDAGKGKEGQL